MNEKAFYSVKACSNRFAVFLSKLGSLIDITKCCKSYFLGGFPKTGEDGLYGIVWRDSLMQVFFHVNTLMQHITDVGVGANLPKDEIIFQKIKKYIDQENVVIIWNETDQEIPEDYLKLNKVDIFIIIKPLVTPYCKIIIKNVKLHVNMQ